MDQTDLFAGAPQPIWRPDPEKVRNRLRRILGEARAASALPWEPARLDLNRIVVEDAARWLPQDEAAEWKAAFYAALERLQPMEPLR
jgi:hypothetical protein